MIQQKDINKIFNALDKDTPTGISIYDVEEGEVYVDNYNHYPNKYRVYKVKGKEAYEFKICLLLDNHNAVENICIFAGVNISLDSTSCNGCSDCDCSACDVTTYIMLKEYKINKPDIEEIKKCLRECYEAIQVMPTECDIETILRDEVNRRLKEV